MAASCSALLGSALLPPSDSRLQALLEEIEEGPDNSECSLQQRVRESRAGNSKDAQRDTKDIFDQRGLTGGSGDGLECVSASENKCNTDEERTSHSFEMGVQIRE